MKAFKNNWTISTVAAALALTMWGVLLASGETVVDERSLMELLIADSVTSTEMETLVTTFGAEGYIPGLQGPIQVVDANAGDLVVFGNSQLAEGTSLYFGDVLAEGNVFHQGVFFNIGTETATIIIGENVDDKIEILSKMMVFVNHCVTCDPSADNDGCSVACFLGCACCKKLANGTAYTCSCIPCAGAGNAGCQSGGEGAFSCSISDT